MYPGYKAGRPERDPALSQQFPIIRQAIAAFGAHLAEAPGFESDDIIATYAHQASESGANVAICNPDKDMLQLVSERVRVYDVIRRTFTDRQKVWDDYGVRPESFADYQALIGDQVDKVPGIRQIGPVKAMPLIARYGTVEEVLANAYGLEHNLRLLVLAGFEDALMSKRLVTLRRDVPVLPYAELPSYEGDMRPVVAFLKACGFQSLTSIVCQQWGLVERAIEPAALTFG